MPTSHESEIWRYATIMMVDDEPTTLDVIEAFLEGEGYENLVAVNDSRQAMAVAAERRPDLVLLDLMMPHVGGVEILKAIRAHPDLRHTPVVILTSSTESATQLEALELGATDFLAKPVDASELALRLRNTLIVKAHRDRLAYLDALTGLPNRKRFVEALGAFVRRGPAASPGAAILQLHVRRIQQIDDALGRKAGDELLKIIATRLETSLQPTPWLGSANGCEIRMLARSERDAFLILLEAPDHADAAVRTARTVLTRLAEPCRIAGQEIAMTGSIGISLFPDDGEGVEVLLANAGIALSHARERGTSFQFHAASLNAESLERVELESQLHRAIERGELEVAYEPKVDIVTGRVVGAEALLRWHNPRLGLVPPGRFIPIAEESGLIVKLGAWVLDEACRQSRAWQDAGFRPVLIAVNVSAGQFRAGDLLETVEAALDSSGLPGHGLRVELTESMIMENPDETARALAGLKRLGVTVSVDDFGTGFSALSTLKRFPIDELKIDRSFIKGIPDDPDDCALVSAVIAMGHALGHMLVAEGVETEVQLEFLRERGCEQFQGYLFSPALGARDWPRFLEPTG